MKKERIPEKMMFGKDNFYHDSSYSKKHDAKKHSNKIRKKGYRFRIVHSKNRYHIYRGSKKRYYNHSKKRKKRRRR